MTAEPRPASVIALLDKQGKLIIKYDGRLSTLVSSDPIVIGDGWLTNTFNNDSVEVKISAELLNETKGRYVSGGGKLVLTGIQTAIEQPIYLVVEQ